MTALFHQELEAVAAEPKAVLALQLRQCGLPAVYQQHSLHRQLPDPEAAECKLDRDVLPRHLGIVEAQVHARSTAQGDSQLIERELGAPSGAVQNDNRGAVGAEKLAESDALIRGVHPIVSGVPRGILSRSGR